MYVQRRFKSICTSAQSDQTLGFPPGETLDPWLPIEHRHGLISLSFPPGETLDPWLPIERPWKALISLCLCCLQPPRRHVFSHQGPYKPVSSIRYKLSCTYSEDSNQSAHKHGLIRVLVFPLEKHWTLGYP